MSVRSRLRHAAGPSAGDPPGGDGATLDWLAGLGGGPAPPPPPETWADRQIRNALALLLARTGHPDAAARAAVVLTAAPDSTEAEHRYGLRAWRAPAPRCDSCGDHHGPAAVCRECGTRWSITAEEPLYDHRPGRGDDPAAPREGLCFACGMASASLPEPRHALPAGAPPCEDDGGGPLALAAAAEPEAGPTDPAPVLEPGPAAPTPAASASNGTTRKPRRKPARPAAPDPAPGG